MEISALQKTLPASDIPLERLAGNSSLSEEQKIAEAGRQFEAVLLRQILQSTQKTVFKTKYADDSTAAGIYHDMVTSQLADSISKSGQFGLAKSFERQLTRQSLPASPAGHDRHAKAQTHLTTGATAVRPGLHPIQHEPQVSRAEPTFKGATSLLSHERSAAKSH